MLLKTMMMGKFKMRTEESSFARSGALPHLEIRKGKGPIR